MREEMASLVYPVLTYGLRLKERVDRGDQLNLMDEQAALKGLLQSESQARRYTDYGGEREGGSIANLARPADGGRRGSDGFLGARYALVCWLDEIFILQSRWGSDWDNNALEVEFYGPRIRAQKFWEQARRAEACQGTDALEVYYLCVMLGFRGECAEAPDRLRDFCGKVEARLGQAHRDWPAPAERKPEMHVPPLGGRDRLQKVILAGFLVLGALIVALAFVFVSRIGHS